MRDDSAPYSATQILAFEFAILNCSQHKGR